MRVDQGTTSKDNHRRAGGEPLADVIASRAIDPTRNRLEGFEALRGVCALIVLFGHAASLAGVATLFIRMHVAVDLFFMLSGYVMARSYEDRLGAELRATTFLIARVRRLWPTVALGTALGFTLVAGWQQPSHTVTALICNLLLIPLMLGSGHVFPFLPVTWTIYFELFANVLHAVVLRQVRTPVLLAIVVVCAGLLVVFQRTPNPGAVGSDFALGFPRVIYAYGAGIILWRVMRDRAIFPAWPAILALLGFTIASHFLLNGVWMDWVFGFVLAPSCIVLGLGTVPFRRFFCLLGALSFPLYAVHGPILIYMTSQGFGMAASIASALVAAAIAWPLTTRVRCLADPTRTKKAPAARQMPRRFRPG